MNIKKIVLLTLLLPSYMLIADTKKPAKKQKITKPKLAKPKKYKEYQRAEEPAKQEQVKKEQQKPAKKAKPEKLKAVSQEKKAQKIETQVAVDSAQAAVSATLQEVDAIAAVIYGKEDTIIITKSEIARPGLDGNMRTLEDLVLERLMYIDAKKYNMLPTEDDIDKHLVSVQKSYNLSAEQVQGMFEEAGYTLKEGREQFAMTTAVQSIVDFKIASRLIVSEKDVKAYYDANPEVEQAAYQLQVVVVPFKRDMSREEQRKNLEKFVEEKRTADPLKPDGMNWSSPFWVDHEDIAEDKHFVFSMKQHGVSMPQETPQGFEMIKLLDKKPERKTPLSDRYRTIVNELRRPKYMAMLEEYKKELHADASIVYF